MAEEHNIIVIEPEDTIRELLAEYFTNLGYDAYQASTISEGIKLVSGGLAKIIILDSGLSPKDTIDDLDRLRQLRPDLKIIIITGYPTLEGIIEALRHGVFDVVVKPFRLADLKETVSRAQLPSEEIVMETVLKERISSLEKLLVENGISFPAEE